MEGRRKRNEKREEERHFSVEHFSDESARATSRYDRSKSQGYKGHSIKGCYHLIKINNSSVKYVKNASM